MGKISNRKGVAMSRSKSILKYIIYVISNIFLTSIDIKKVINSRSFSFIKKFICPLLVYILAAIVVALNVSLMFDNVVWGDEAFSVNTVRNSFYGIMQILYYWDCHPPLHYIWTKLFGDIFGHTIIVFHLAALVPFIIGIGLAVTAFRRQFGNIAATVFVVISGLGSTCLEYNLEIRMYSLTFLGVFAAFYCSYKVIHTGKKSAWIGMVLWALEAAYSHYYGLVTVGILLFCTGVAIWLKNRGKSWLKGFGAIIAFLIGYSPWLFFLFTAMENVSNSWWMTDILGLDRTLEMVMGGHGLNTFIFPMVLLLVVVLLLAESAVFRIQKKDGKINVTMKKPSIKNWSDEMYTVIVGVFTIIGTILFAYLVCYIFTPMLAQRYMYPLSAITFVILGIAMSRVFALLEEFGSKVGFGWLEIAAKTIAIGFLAIFLVIGAENYKNYREIVLEQSIKTNATLNLIGQPEDDVVLVTNGVKHLGWTILPCYFPETEYVNGNYVSAGEDKFWYFNPAPLSDAELEGLENEGYTITFYGQMQISIYEFSLYYIEK